MIFFSKKQGDIVLILEAMKMENMVKSPKDGIIAEILVEETHFVDGGKTQIRFEE